MLQIDKSRLIAEEEPSASEFVSPAELYGAVVGFVRRQYPVIGFVLVCTLALGAVYLITAPARYTSSAILIIDTHKNQVFQQQSVFGDMQIDGATVDTQIEILKSENIGLSVIKDLHLTEDPDFASPSRGVLNTVVDFFTNVLTFGFSSIPPAGPRSDFDLQRTALGAFQSGLSVGRVGVTYAIAINFQARNPDRSAQVANAVADAYVVDELEAKYQTTRRAAVWLQDRLKDLRQETSNAERAVVDYKTKNNIVDTGGKLMNEQQLAELSSALIQARALSAETKARLDQVQQVLSTDNLDPSGNTAATVSESLHNDVITNLRKQYLDYAGKLSLWTQKYGPDHLAVVNVRNQMREIQHSILDELRRIAETYKSDYEVAKTREASVQKSLDQIVAESQTTNEAQITLHDLESTAQTYKSLYDNFLTRYMESVQQQSFPISEARLVTQASRGYKSAPRTTMVMAMAAMGGLLLGMALGVLRDIGDRVFRTTGQVEERLHADSISVVPLVEGAPQSAVALKPVAISGKPAGPRTILRHSGMHWTVVESPFSRYAEAIRAIKVAADLSRAGKPSRVIGITSSLPNEGKSTIAMALTQLIAHGGRRALLVDCDLRNPSLTRELAPDAKAGLLDIIYGNAIIESVVWTDPESRLAFLPAVVPSRLAHSSEILASEATRKVFEKLRDIYDYVIVDLSPLAPVVDVRVMAHLVDSFVFVIEWGATKIDVVEHALGSARGVRENLLGVVLNKADMTSFGRYESHRSNYYYNRYYARYGYTD